MNYEKKYLNYKIKYLKLRKQMFGGYVASQDFIKKVTALISTINSYIEEMNKLLKDEDKLNGLEILLKIFLVKYEEQLYRELDTNDKHQYNYTLKIVNLVKTDTNPNPLEYTVKSLQVYNTLVLITHYNIPPKIAVQAALLLTYIEYKYEYNKKKEIIQFHNPYIVHKNIETSDVVKKQVLNNMVMLIKKHGLTPEEALHYIDVTILLEIDTLDKRILLNKISMNETVGKNQDGSDSEGRAQYYLRLISIHKFNKEQALDLIKRSILYNYRTGIDVVGLNPDGSDSTKGSLYQNILRLINIHKFTIEEAYTLSKQKDFKNIVIGIKPDGKDTTEKSIYKSIIKLIHIHEFTTEQVMSLFTYNKEDFYKYKVGNKKDGSDSDKSIFQNIIRLHVIHKFDLKHVLGYYIDQTSDYIIPRILGPTIYKSSENQQSYVGIKPDGSDSSGRFKILIQYKEKLIPKLDKLLIIKKQFIQNKNKTVTIDGKIIKYSYYKNTGK